MHPYLLSMGDRMIPAYPLLYGSGIAVGGIVVLLLGGRIGLDPRKLAHLILTCAVAMLVGGRLFYVVQHSDQFVRGPAQMCDLSHGGQVLYGGLLLAIPPVLLAIRLLRLPLHLTADLFAVGVPLGLAVGRLACYCRGCCYGVPSDLPWAVQYPKHIDLGGVVVGPPAFLTQLRDGLISDAANQTMPVHPAPIYASLLSLVVFMIMLWLWKRNRYPGKLMIVYTVVYAAMRFGLDFAREYKMAFWGLTVSQVVSMAVFAAGMAILVRTRKGAAGLHSRGRGEPASRAERRRIQRAAMKRRGRPAACRA